MKKNFKYAILSAIALVGAVSFSACQSSDEIVDNPNYDSERNAVKAEFTISIPGVKNATRMDVATVQGQTDPVFVGMRDIKLLPYGDATVDGNSTLLGDPAAAISLLDLDASGLTALTAESDGTENNAKVYTNVAIPVNTEGFLVYGVGQAAAPSTVDDRFAKGVITTPSSWTGAPSTFSFGLQSINDNSAVSAAKNIITYLKGIAAATGWSSETSGKYKTLYDNFTGMKAGSSFSIMWAVQNLYDNVVNDAAGTIGENIRNAILATTYVPDGGSTGKAFATAATTGVLTFADDIKEYPECINLPDGAVSLSWDSSNPKVPSYAATGGTGIGGVSSALTNLSLYTYPASLYYRSNSAIKVSNYSESEHYVATNKWSDVLASYEGGTKVTKNTRSVVIATPLQYAVGRLDLRIKTEAAVLKDKAGEDVTLVSGGFPVSAILIGGQNSVNFEFEKTGAEGWTIYDKAVSGIAATSTGYSDYNYTLVLETAANDAINIAVELTNNTGFAFNGQDGVIPAGGKFYLLASLDPTKAKAGSGDTGSKVFAQDFVTTVDLTIGLNDSGSHDKGLGAAYNVLPDLRSTELELGMSVNLEWQNGLIFDPTI